MICLRCQGFCVGQTYYEARQCFTAWRCVNCGNVMEATLLENRRNPPAVKLGVPVGRRVYEE